MCEKSLEKRVSSGDEIVAAIDEILASSQPETATRTVEKAVPPVEGDKDKTARGSGRPDDPRRRRTLRVACAGLLLLIVAMGAVVLLKPHLRSRHVAPASSNTAPAPRHVVAVSRGTAPTETTGTKVESVPTPSLPKPHLAQPLVQNVSLFQPQKGSPEQILSRLDRVLGERPKYLKISLSACAKRNDWSIERYEHQVLVPVVERLRGAGVGFSLVPGSGKYGAVVLDVAKRFGCDLN